MYILCLRFGLVVLLTLFMVSCDQVNESDPQLTVEEVTITPDRLALPTLIPEPLESKPLLLWIPDVFTQSEDVQEMLKRFIRNFENIEDEILVDWRIKAREGIGGNLSRLRNALEVATTAVPDLMLMRRNEMMIAMDEGLLHEWLEIPEDLLSDLPDLFLVKGEDNGRLYGIPYAITLTHLAYDSGLDREPPLIFSYEDILDKEVSIAYPLEDDMVMREILITQLSNSDEILNEDANSAELLAALQEIFTYYETATASGIIFNSQDEEPDNSAKVITSDEFLQRVREGNTIRFAPIPNQSGMEMALVDTWYWVLPKADIARRQFAQRFMLWMMNETRLSEYLSLIGTLPARLSLYSAATLDSYSQFVHTSLTKIEKPILFDESVGNLIYRNFQAILQGEVSSREALQEVEVLLQENP